MKIVKTPAGWFVETDTGLVGPFPHHGAAADWILEQGEVRDQQERQSAAEARAQALSNDALVRALNAAIANPPKAPRGRPMPDNSREADIAFEYYWRLRKHKRKRGNPTRIVAELAKLYGCTADHVRKVRQEYAAVEGYDKKLLAQLRAQALQRRSRKPVSKPLPPTASKLELVKQWLRDLLKGHSLMLAETVFQRAHIAGFSHRTVERAAHSLDIKRVGRGRSSSWRLPPEKSAKRSI